MHALLYCIFFGFGVVVFLSPVDFLKNKLFHKCFQDYHKRVKQFGSRSGPTSVGPDLGPNCLL